MVLMMVVVNLSAMVAARGAASLAEPLSIMPGWANNIRGRVWSAILIIKISMLVIIMISIMPGWAKRSKSRVWLAILIIIMVSMLLLLIITSIEYS